MPGPARDASSARSNGGWTPRVANLVVLIAIEIGLYCVMRWAFRTAHGG